MIAETPHLENASLQGESRAAPFRLCVAPMMDWTDSELYQGL
jgi:hypothetical protein